MATRKAAASKPDPFPFPFLAHGPWSASDYRESADWLVVFESAVPAAKQHSILKSTPKPLGKSSWSGDRVLLLTTGQDAGVGLWNAYSGQKPLSAKALERGDFEGVVITSDQIKAFCGDVDQWLLKTHAAARIGLVVGTTDKEDKWHRWSVKQFPVRLLPMFESVFELPRPRSKKTKAPNALEGTMAFALMNAVEGYIGSEGLDACAPDLLRRLLALFERAHGFSDEADYSIFHMRKNIKERR